MLLVIAENCCVYMQKYRSMSAILNYMNLMDILEQKEQMHQLSNVN